MLTLDPIEIPLPGPHLVEASAGTGKTYTIATLFVRLVIERGIDVDRILVVTFTEAAAAELRDRIRVRLRTAVDVFERLAAGRNGEGLDADLLRLAERRRARGDLSDDLHRLELALRTFDEAPISTIHAFCQRVLAERAFETTVRADAVLLPDEGPLITEIVHDFWASKVYGEDPTFVAYLRQPKPKLRIEQLVKLARMVASQVDVPVLPPKVRLGKAPDIARFVANFRRAREVWQGDREAIARCLDFKGLHSRVLDKMPALLAELERYFEPKDPGFDLGPTGLYKLTPSELAAKTKVAFKSAVPCHAFFDACAELVRSRDALREHYDARLLQLRRNLVDDVRKRLPDRKRDKGLLSFDDLLHNLRDALTGTAGKTVVANIRARYQAALIDEFQDTDAVQWAIFAKIYGGTEQPFFLIGDPKQAIYSFRGADVFTYLQAARTVRRSQYTMSTNWRSDAPLLHALHRLFDVARPFALAEIGYTEVAPRPEADARLFQGDEPLPGFEVRFVPRTPERSKTPKNKWGGKSKDLPTIDRGWVDDNLADLVAADISALLGGDVRLGEGPDARPVHAGDVAVLVRKNAQAQRIQTALRALDIPSVVYGDASVWDTAEAEELEHVLAAIAEPTRNGLLRAALTTELLGVTAHELEALNVDDRGFARRIDSFRRWHALWTERGFVQMFRAMLAESEADRRLLRLVDGERRMTNLLHLAELLHTQATTSHLGPAGLLRYFGQERRNRAAPTEAMKLRLERDDEAVQIITVHRSKGLEFPIVYCPYLWAPEQLFGDDYEILRFHDPEDRDRLKIDLTPKGYARDQHPHVQQARLELHAESMRLAYVALTRARHRCVVVWGGFDHAAHSALGYLLHAPPSDADTDTDHRAAVAGRIARLDDAALLAHLRERGAGRFAVSMLGDVEPKRYAPPSPAPPTLRARRPRRDIDTLWRTSSFTHMTATVGGGRGPGLPGADEGRDHDERARLFDDPLQPLRHDGRPTPLGTFARGAKVGNLFHGVLERLDFEADEATMRELVASHLLAYGYDAQAWQDQVVGALRDVLHTELVAGSGLRLVDVSQRERLDEFGFMLGIAGPSPSASPSQVSAQQLSQVFARHPEGLPEGYAERVAKLRFEPLRGFLKGFLDLAFVASDRWYVVDYKTNDLGPTFDAYTPDRLAAVMGHEHYVLQYHLYVVALCRFLRQRIHDFDYDRHFAGVLYLFVRGMHPDHGPASGVYFERPPAARIAALDALLGGPGEGPR